MEAPRLVPILPMLPEPRAPFPADMFKILMGEEVGARRDFIEQHALEITDLDI
ncbi:MAG: hypothetical protein AMXMBFR7_52870 [Planctomycetota bacterium]